MRRSREIPPVPSLHRPSTDGLISQILVQFFLVQNLSRGRRVEAKTMVQKNRF